MTNEERQQAIEWLKRRPATMAGAKRMYDLAIDALEAYAPDINVGDTISKQAALDALNEYFARIGKMKRGGLREKAISLDVVGAIKDLPPVQPEIIRCKECKFARMTVDGECKYCDIWFPDEKTYMPGDYYCGSAEMRGEADGQE